MIKSISLGDANISKAYLGSEIIYSSSFDPPDSSAGDEHWDKVVTLLNFDGDTVDLTGREWTVTGSPAFTTDPAKFGQSIYLPNRNTWLQTAENPLVSLESFTIETFFCIPSGHGSPTNYHAIAGQTNSGSGKGQTFWARSDGTIRFSRGPSVGSAVDVSGVTPVLNDVVYHAALTYDYPTGKLRLFLDGNLEAEADNAVGWIPENRFTIGSYINTSYTTYGLYGYLDDFRITKGVARYTENFTPPTEPFPLL